MTEHDYLKEFCGAILAHLEGGEKPEWFHAGWGLCSNYASLLDTKGRNRHESISAAEKLFPKEFPFGGPNRYFAESFGNKLYTNPQRLAFIKEHAQ